ncbi:uncharacterized protein LOC126788659 [Argentina anserina]|uniref:uncharacterized protein LOC126788659 n=1 Tax=Argentina anserina TaxID=57926 RepID=UPI002176770E|nr:uncharacterized protein LOC126788659 [Potentilla anserina]
MEHVDDGPFEASSSKNQKVEANDLLEECWFFDNLLIRKQRMLRCYSDPCCPSPSSFGQEMLVKNSEAKNSLVRTPSLPLNVGREEKVEEAVNHNTPKKCSSKLTRQTSHQKILQTPTKSPPCVSRREDDQDGEKSDSRRSKSYGQPVQRSLLRTPSLPPCFGREEKNQESIPQRHKGMTQCSSIPRYRPPVRITEGENDVSKELRRNLLSRKSLSELEIEEVQGFKDLGFTFDKKDIAPSVVSILPGLQEKKRNEDVNPDMVRRPYLSEAWLVQSCAPPPPNLGAGRSAEDMKAQIKFWARSVASNVR